ncbi:MAG: tetrahydrofolate dehydrogenase/cyclohydrolase catalytic domain-containing protein [Longimicrobiales bacterium]
MTILDGTGLAGRRTPMLLERARAVHSRRGRAPALLIVAFSDEPGRVAHVDRKVRAARSAGIDVTPLIIPPGVSTPEAAAKMHAIVRAQRMDGVFVQFPFPETIDGEAFGEAIPAELDVDVMTPAGIARFMKGMGGLPPVTASAGLLLLDEYGISIAQRRGVMVADERPFSQMFRTALMRRGALMEPLIDPGARDRDRKVREAELVVVAAGSPGLVQSATLASGAVAIDVGYFNPGGRGDIDLSGGFQHLAAVSPVPGGIGPMTVSALIERVVMFAEC